MTELSAPVAIIGMHRSGTSCLAGCLQDLGLSLGDVVTSAPHNRKGNRENPRLWPVHDAVLARVGASWDRPPLEPVIWTGDEKRRLREALQEYEGLPRPWGFKDPRATVLLDGWHEVVPGLRLVASIRTPGAVAASLQARNGFEIGRGLAIWSAYNRAVLAWRQRLDFPIVDYDAADYEVRVRRIAAGLGLRSDLPMPFRDTELRHQEAVDPSPSEAALWQELREAAR